MFGVLHIQYPSLVYKYLVYVCFWILRGQLVFSRRHREASLLCLLHLLEVIGIDVISHYCSLPRLHLLIHCSSD